LVFNITILGTNAALPGSDSITSAQVVNVHDQLYIVDCGEGMQGKLQKYRIKRNRIHAIFISHLHGDHFFGLPGLLTSYSHFQRKSALQIIGPKGIHAYVDTCLRLSEAYIDFEIHFHEMEHEGNELVYEDRHVKVMAFPLLHRITTYGFRFDEIGHNCNIRPDKIRELGLTTEQIKYAKMGNDIMLPDGKMVKNADIIFRKSEPRSYAYCSDTAYDESIVEYIRNTNVLYHEATYLSDMAIEAKKRMHSTVEDATKMAIISGVGKLILGHFSRRYMNKEDFLREGKMAFNEVTLAEEGKIIEIHFEKKNIKK
jgi:ribonuclease Z